MSEKNTQQQFYVAVVAVLFAAGLGLGWSVNGNSVDGREKSLVPLVNTTYTIATVTVTSTATLSKVCAEPEMTTGGGTFQGFLTGVGVQEIGGCTYTWLMFLHPEGFRTNLLVRGINLDYKVGPLYSVSYRNLPDGTHSVQSMEVKRQLE